MTFPVHSPKPLFEDLPLHEIDDHADRALDRLLTQLHEKPRFAALVRLLEKPLQELEGVFWDLERLRTLETAQGAQLDMLGRILQETRGPLADDDYRVILRIKILVLKSSGRAPELIQIVDRFLTGAGGVSFVFGFNEYFPAAIAVDLPPTTTLRAQLLARFLRLAKSAGVRIDVWNGSGPARFTSTLSGGGFGSFTSTLSGGGLGSFGGVL